MADIERRITQCLSYTRSRKKHPKWWATAIRLTTLTLSASATIILGLQNLSTAASVAFSFTALVTLLGAVEPFFNFRSRWVALDKGQADVHRLQDDLSFHLASLDGGNPDEADLREYHDRLQAIWVAMSNQWHDDRQGAITG